METHINDLNEGLSLKDLEILKLSLEDRIKRLESDLKKPLDPDMSEQAGQLSNLIILKRLLEVERSQLRKINFEIEKKRLAF